MGNTVQLGIKITSDTQSAASGLQNTNGILGKVKIAALAVAGALTAIGIAAGKYALDAISAAGDLGQSIGAVDVVFKDSAGQIHDWAQSAAQDVGLARNEYNELGTLIGTQLKNGGTAMAEFAPKTQELIGLGADLSSMFGGTTKDAVEALSSALKGERDPIERYGVSLNQARIDAKAAEMGFEKVGGALSAEANQAATLALIMEQTADAHGNFAREADTLQGKQQRFAAQMENTKAIIGTALLPVATALFGFFNDKLGPALGDLANKFGAFVSGLDIVGWWTNLTTGVSGATDVLALVQPLVAGIVDWFNTQLRPALEGLSAAFIERFEVVRQVVGEFAAGVWAALEPLLPQIQTTFTTIGDIVTQGVELFTAVWDAGTRFFLEAWNLIGGPLLNVISTVFNAIVGIIGPAVNLIKSIISTALSLIRGDWSGAWDGVRNIARNAWDLITGIIRGANDVIRSVISGALDILKSLWSSAWDTIKTVLSTAWDAIKTAVSNGIDNVKGFFQRLPGQIKGFLTSLPNTLANIGRQMVQGLINGIKNMGSKVAGTIKNVVSSGLNAAKRFLGIASPSKVFRQLGTWTGEGLVQGLRSQVAAVGHAGQALVGAAVPDDAPEIPISVHARRGTTAAGAPINITINGAVDPLSTARQIRSLLLDLGRHEGDINLNSEGLAWM